MHSFIPSTLRRFRNQRHLTLENVSGIAGMSVQHLSEIESSKRDPRLSSIERIADAMELAVAGARRHGA
jgi:transcriptional regulator with XRE-family HTH domain